MLGKLRKAAAHGRGQRPTGLQGVAHAQGLNLWCEPFKHCEVADASGRIYRIRNRISNSLVVATAAAAVAIAITIAFVE